MRKIILPFLILALSSSLTACQGDDAKNAAAAAAVPEGWSMRHFGELEMALPDSWVFVDDTSAVMNRIRDDLKESNPGVFAQLERLSGENRPAYVYLAFDSESKKSLVQMSVAKGNAGIASRIPLVDYTKIIQKQLASAGIDLTIVGEMNIGDMDAVKVSTVSGNMKVHQSGLIFTYDKAVYSMFLTFLDADSPKYTLVFDTAISTLRESPKS